MNRYNDLTLFTPGPVSIAPRVLLAGASPMIHHRTPEFHAILENVICKMKGLFGTAGDVLMVHTSGRGAMEGVLCNLFSSGDKLLCICNGQFGVMFADIAENCGLKSLRLFEGWHERVSLPRLDEALKNDPDIKGVTVVHSDTSTAAINPVAEIGDLVCNHDRLLVVDSISSLGVMAFCFDEWKVDAAITASQKGLMAPAGLSFVAFSDRAWQAVEAAKNIGYYINFKNIKTYYDEKKETPGSTPVSLVASVNESLRMIYEEGLENVYERHKMISRAIKSGLAALGLTILPENNADRSFCLTMIQAPGKTAPGVIKEMAKEKYGVLIASGLGELKDTTLRFGHMGITTIREALLAVSVMEMVLLELGHLDRPGRGLQAFSASLATK